MMGPVLLYDHSPVEDSDSTRLCQQLQRYIDRGSCHLVDLLDGGERTRPILVQQGERGWQTQQYVGMFEFGDWEQRETQRVVIASRFDKGREQPWFLWYLMEHFLEESLLDLQDLTVQDGDSSFDVLLACKLASQLQQAWRKGPFRAYRAFEHNDNRVRGQLDVSRHIRENAGRDNGRIAYRTRSYSLDNPLNALFLQAVGTVRRRQPSLIRRLEQKFPEFRAALWALEQDIPGWSGLPRDHILEHTRKKLANPIYRSYEPARRTARDILRRMGASPSSREGGPVVTGVFLDIDALWERVLQRQLLRAPDWIYQPERLRVWDNRLEVRPDFLRQDRNAVLDAKNRPAWESTLDQAHWEYVSDDVYQLFFYMNTLNSSDGGVIFPSSEHTFDSDAKPIAMMGRNFWRIPVQIPKEATDYGAFRTGLNGELDRLRSLPPICKA